MHKMSYNLCAHRVFLKYEKSYMNSYELYLRNEPTTTPMISHGHDISMGLYLGLAGRSRILVLVFSRVFRVTSPSRFAMTISPSRGVRPRSRMTISHE